METKYRHVYFRIDTESYKYQNSYVGFTNEEQRKSFYDSIVSLFTTNGWQVEQPKYSGSCPTVIKGKQSLYLHPRSFSGVVSMEELQEIEQLLSQGTTFKHYHMDIYREVYDLTDEEYLTYLETKREDITKDILETYKTKRRNLYKVSYVPESIYNKYKLERIGSSCDGRSNGQLGYKFVCGIFKELLEQEAILSTKTRKGIGYRTVTPKDRPMYSAEARYYTDEVSQ